MRNLIKFGAVLAGASAGAAVGVLLMPEKRKKISNMITDHLKSGADAFKDSKENFKELVSDLTSSKNQDFDTVLNSIVDKAADKKDQVISILEQKISEMKSDGKTHPQHNPSNIKDDVVYKAAYETKVDL